MYCPTLYLVYPSGQAREERIEAGLSLLGEASLVHLRPSPGSHHPYLAGTDAARTETILAALTAADSRLIMAVRGGYGAVRLDLDAISDALGKTPKSLMGFSDVTFLLYRWHAAGGYAIHGPVLTQLPELVDEDLAAVLELLHEGRWCLDAPLTALVEARTCWGPLFGANLSVLETMIGYSWFPDLTGAILILEDVNEPPYKLDRMLTHLLETTSLRDVQAIVLGDFAGCGPWTDVFQEVLGRYSGISLFSGVPVGHARRNRPFALGAQGNIVMTTTGWGLEARGALP